MVLQEWCRVFSSASTVLRLVFFGRPRFRFPSGVQWRAVRMMLSCSRRITCPIHLHTIHGENTKRLKIFSRKTPNSSSSWLKFVPVEGRIRKHFPITLRPTELVSRFYANLCIWGWFGYSNNYKLFSSNSTETICFKHFPSTRTWETTSKMRILWMEIKIGKIFG